MMAITSSIRSVVSCVMTCTTEAVGNRRQIETALTSNSSCLVGADSRRERCTSGSFSGIRWPEPPCSRWVQELRTTDGHPACDADTYTSQSCASSLGQRNPPPSWFARKLHWTRSAAWHGTSTGTKIVGQQKSRILRQQTSLLGLRVHGSPRKQSQERHPVGVPRRDVRVALRHGRRRQNPQGWSDAVTVQFALADLVGRVACVYS